MNDFYIFPQKPDEIYHYGIKGRSGRYPWGSGDRPYQRLEKQVGKLERKVERSKKISNKDEKRLRLEAENRAMDRMAKGKKIDDDDEFQSIFDEFAGEEYEKLLSDKKGLSNRDKKKISKEYYRTYEKGRKERSKIFDRLYKEAEERAMDRIDERERILDDDEFNDLFYKFQREEHEKLLDNFVRTNKYYNLAEKISEEFQMESWDPKAKENSDYIKNLYKLAEEADRR